MDNAIVVINALADKIAALEQEKLDLIRGNDMELDKCSDEYDLLALYLIEITTDDFAGFIAHSRAQIAQASKRELRSTVSEVCTAIDVIRWKTSEEIQALFDYYAELGTMLDKIDAELK